MYLLIIARLARSFVSPHDSPMAAESDLYLPVKAFLEGQGYAVKGEVKGCDVVGVRGDEPPVVVELKRGFGLALVLQGVDRLALTDRVYLAVGAWPRRMRHVKKLCRRLGFGFLIVSRKVEVVLDPVPYVPRKNKRRAGLLLGEHARRVGDPNRGGASTRVPMITAYRQEALRCAALLAARGAMTVAALRAADDVPNAGKILQKDYYGWFQRIERATYALTPEGRRGLARFLPPPPAAPAEGAVATRVAKASVRRRKAASPTSAGGLIAND
jgi:hypothetical protein